LLDVVERGRTGLARLSTPAIGRDLFGGCPHFLGQAHPQRAFYRADVGHPAGVEPCQKVRIVSVARIGYHRLDGQAPLLGLIQQLQGNLGLGLLRQLCWHMRPLTALAICDPGLRQAQLRVDGKVKRATAGRVVGQLR